jgi:hypothetical protein
MCNPIAFQVIGTMVSVMGQMKQGEAQQQQANAQAQATLNDGAYKADAATAQAEKIRKAGKAQVGEANAALAASGVKLGEGTPLEVKKTIVQNSEEDALSALLTGKRATATAQEEASMLGKAGENAQSSAMFGAAVGAAGTVLKAGGDYMKDGWKSAATGK